MEAVNPLDVKLTFGRHAGRSIGQMLTARRESYLMWCLQNMTKTPRTAYVLEAIEEVLGVAPVVKQPPSTRFISESD